jgi:hypothetical protein
VKNGAESLTALLNRQHTSHFKQRAEVSPARFQTSSNFRKALNMSQLPRKDRKRKVPSSP